ncbi:MAG: hypothetical protein K0B37_02730 [Bacteroidales bacterium]|nr:hypothetical protein [Bacteroidales bacterium]
MNTEEQDFTDPRVLRKKAEEQLKRKQGGENRLKETDVKKLLHELQVHQIELEMQNEELRQAYVSAEEALKKYTLMYDFAPLGYFTLDSDGNICDLNFTGAEMLGDKRVSLASVKFRLFVSEESHAEFDYFFHKVFTTGAKESCELTIGYVNNPLRFVYAEGIVTGDDNRCLLSVVDISSFIISKHP